MSCLTRIVAFCEQLVLQLDQTPVIKSCEAKQQNKSPCMNDTVIDSFIPLLRRDLRGNQGLCSAVSYLSDHKIFFDEFHLRGTYKTSTEYDSGQQPYRRVTAVSGTVKVNLVKQTSLECLPHEQKLLGILKKNQKTFSMFYQPSE